MQAYWSNETNTSEMTGSNFAVHYYNLPQTGHITQTDSLKLVRLDSLIAEE